MIIWIASYPKSGNTWVRALLSSYLYYKKKSFSPNFINDISKFWNKKKLALLAYKQELHRYPNSRSLKGIEILSKYRGNQNGLKFAEAFILVKEILN